MKQAHIPILLAFDDLRFHLGKKTLADFLKGDPHPTITRNRLDELNAYGCLYMLDKQMILDLLDLLVQQGFLKNETVKGGFQVLTRTPKGLKEQFSKEFVPKLSSNKDRFALDILHEKTTITEEDKTLFATFDFFLSSFNDEQKKAILSRSKRLLCIAGAGSGKTTVLTKRIEFLVRFSGAKQEKILAITFSRKARDEMKERLDALGMDRVRVETFNSFCEQFLRRHEAAVFEMEKKILSFNDKIMLVKSFFEKKSYDLALFADTYFSKKALSEKSSDELFFSFVYDVFSLLDHYKSIGAEIEEFYEKETDSAKKRVAKMMYECLLFVLAEMKKRRFRDFSDQIHEALSIMKQREDLIPSYEYLFVDEFQDVNAMQVELIHTLNPNFLFAVGDPRQAIYGWRGADISFILDFAKKFEDVEVVQLQNNYRSSKVVVDVCNSLISPLGLVDLSSASAPKENEHEDKGVFFFEQSSEQVERIFVASAIQKSLRERNEIFVLARTHRILENFAETFDSFGIRYIIKQEQLEKDFVQEEGKILLGTVHSVKGMEAEEVFVVGVNGLSFPNKVQDNFVFALAKDMSGYDKEAEELRLLYVALSRAKEKLVITYTGSPSPFLNSSVLSKALVAKKSADTSLFSHGIGNSNKNSSLDPSNSSVLRLRLKEWRAQVASERGIPSYMVLSNSALDSLLRTMPQRKEELVQVKGIGEQKILRYGDELIRILHGA
ncbi:MAG: UvrD-helicase domain-containing protein [Nanoarchaeota archaeon]|nr:UvrD-helicase domain-containing protein [Nanoarchaeota archaeon]